MNYTIEDYRKQVEATRCELDTLRDIVDEFADRWSAIRESIDETIDSLEDLPTED